MDVKCVVSCTNANGEPDFFFCKVAVSMEEYEDGQHYDLARKKANEEGYEEQMVVYDEHDGPDWLFARFAWNTVGALESPMPFAEWFESLGDQLLVGWLRAKEDGNEEPFGNWIQGEYDHYLEEFGKEIYEVPYIENGKGMLERAWEGLPDGITLSLGKIDWRMLRLQKMGLVYLLSQLPDGWYEDVDWGKEDITGDEQKGIEPVASDLLDGLLHLLDHMQDEAAKIVGNTEVFGPEPEEVAQGGQML